MAELSQPISTLLPLYETPSRRPARKDSTKAVICTSVPDQSKHTLLAMAIDVNTTSAPSSTSLREISTDELERGLSSIRSTPATGRFSNWAGTYSCTPNAIFRAQNEEQLRYLIELAKRQKRKLRPFGAGHSPSDLVCVAEEDWLVNLDALDKIIDVSGHLDS